MSPPQLLLAKHFITHVKGKQQQPTWFQHSVHFPKYQGQVFFKNIHDGIESGDPGKYSILKVQRHHVSFRKEMSGLSRRACSSIFGERTSPSTVKHASRR